MTADAVRKDAAIRAQALIVGARISGLCQAVRTSKAGMDFLVLEKARDVGETTEPRPRRQVRAVARGARTLAPSEARARGALRAQRVEQPPRPARAVSCPSHPARSAQGQLLLTS
jgi:cation diffusion facilitator CzcD-associated flavoprotein CzcO